MNWEAVKQQVYFVSQKAKKKKRKKKIANLYNTVGLYIFKQMKNSNIQEEN